MQILQIDSTPNQSFQAVLTIDGVNRTFSFNIHFNEIAEYWVMKIMDPSTDEILLDSIPLVTGNDPVVNILSQYAYMEIGSLYLINIGGTFADPTIDNLGTSFVLLWGDTP